MVLLAVLIHSGEGNGHLVRSDPSSSGPGRISDRFGVLRLGRKRVRLSRKTLYMWFFGHLFSLFSFLFFSVFFLVLILSFFSFSSFFYFFYFFFLHLFFFFFLLLLFSSFSSYFLGSSKSDFFGLNCLKISSNISFEKIFF